VAASADVAHGFVREGLTVDSKILGRPVSYSIYLPYDYESSSRSYPVVYLLHGLGDNDTAWIQFGRINLIADEAIAAQQIEPMIIVMPDAGRSWYVDSFDGKANYEEFFFKEFIPTVEAKFRIIAKRQFRGVSGLSMGGYGSLVYSMHHPDVFGSCAAFSCGIYTEDEVLGLPKEGWNCWDNFFSQAFGPGLVGEARFTKHWRECDPLEMVKNNDLTQLCSVRYYIDCGDDDFLSKGNCALHILMRERGVPHEFRVRDGAHAWTYWRSGIRDGLAFISQSFHQN
jgi:enterochelin esterase-like enzyme